MYIASVVQRVQEIAVWRSVSVLREEAQRANIISDMLQIKLNWQTPPVNSSIVPLEAEMATLCIDGGKKPKCARVMY